MSSHGLLVLAARLDGSIIHNVESLTCECRAFDDSERSDLLAEIHGFLQRYWRRSLLRKSLDHLEVVSEIGLRLDDDEWNSFYQPASIRRNVGCYG